MQKPVSDSNHPDRNYLQFQVLVGHVGSEAATVVHGLRLMGLLCAALWQQGSRPLPLLLLLLLLFLFILYLTLLLLLLVKLRL